MHNQCNYMPCILEKCVTTFIIMLSLSLHTAIEILYTVIAVTFARLLDNYVSLKRTSHFQSLFFYEFPDSFKCFVQNPRTKGVCSIFVRTITLNELKRSHFGNLCKDVLISLLFYRQGKLFYLLLTLQTWWVKRQLLIICVNLTINVVTVF